MSTKIGAWYNFLWQRTLQRVEPVIEVCPSSLFIADGSQKVLLSHLQLQLLSLLLLDLSS